MKIFLGNLYARYLSRDYLPPRWAFRDVVTIRSSFTAYEALVWLYADGASIEELAELYERTRERIRQLLMKAWRMHASAKRS